MDNKSLINQYVDTGLKIPEYQLMQLSNNDKKTYLRKRLIASEQKYDIEKYEFDLMDATQRAQIGKLVQNKIDSGWQVLEKWELDTMDPIFAKSYIDYRVMKGYHIPESIFESLPDNNKLDYLTNLILNRPEGRKLKDYEFDTLSEDLKIKYAIRESLKTNKKSILFGEEDKVNDFALDYLPEPYLSQYLKTLVRRGAFLLNEKEFGMLPRESMDIVINSIIARNGYLNQIELAYAKPEQKMEYFGNKIKNGGYVSHADKEWYDNVLAHGQ